MFQSRRYILLLVPLLMLSVSPLMSQSSSLGYGVDSTSYIGKYDRIYQLVSEQKVDVNTLIKFDAVQWGQIQPSVTVEQRLWRDLTIEPNITMSSLEWSRSEGLNFAFNPNVSLKYYYNRSRRERLGMNVIGFSADYFLLGFSYTLTDDKTFFNYELGNHYMPYGDGTDGLTEDFYHYTAWHFMYGLQRKIGNMAYADLAIGVEKHYFNEFGVSKLMPSIKIKLGFALSVEQFKRFSR